MRHLMIVVAMSLFGSAALADPALGTWQTQAGETGGYAHVVLAPCNGKICGTITKVFNNANTSAEGRQIVAGMSPNGGGKYSGGTIWAPDQDKTYQSRMELSGDSLEVKGCVLGGLVCRGQTWMRVN